MRSDTYRAKAQEMAKLAEGCEPGEDRAGYARLSAVWAEMAQLAEKLEAALGEGKT